MFPYLIAGAIGYAVAKIFESDDEAPKYADGGEARPFTDDGNKLVVFNQYRNYTPYKIAVDDVNDAEYITLWKTNIDTGKDKKIGYLRLNETSNGFLSVSEISIDRGSKGLGLGLEMYKVALKYSSDKIKGIKSYLPNRTNKKQIPKIYNKLNSVKDGDYEYILKEHNPDIRFDEGGELYSEISKEINEVNALSNKDLTPMQLQYLNKKLLFFPSDKMNTLRKINKNLWQELWRKQMKVEDILKNKQTKKGVAGYLNEKYMYHFTTIFNLTKIVEDKSIGNWQELGHIISLTTNPIFGEVEVSGVKSWNQGMEIKKATLFSDLSVKIVFNLQKIKADGIKITKGSGKTGTHFGEYELIIPQFNEKDKWWKYVSWIEIDKNKKEIKEMLDYKWVKERNIKDVMQLPIDIWIKGKQAESTLGVELKKLGIEVREREKIDVEKYLFGDKKPKYADGGLIAPNGKSSNTNPYIYDNHKLVKMIEDSIEKDGSSFICTYVASAVKMLEGNNVKIYGFSIYNNPDAEYFSDEEGDEGHHFAVLDDRYILDAWIFNNYQHYQAKINFNRSVFDLQNKEDEKIIKFIYGNRNKWVDITKNVENFADLFPRTYKDLIDGYELISESNYVDGTNTTFDGNNPDIRFDDGGVIDEYLKYFKENNIIVNNISDLGSGDYSKTYKIDTNKGEFALNIRSEMVGDYSSLIDEYYDYLPTIYDVRNINGKYCIVMEVLLPISTDEKNIIDCIDYLFYANDEDGLDVWLEDNLRYDLYLKVEELMGETDIDRISEKQYIDKLKWFYDNYGDYETFINDIQSAFQEYNEALGFNYVDFHGDNLMQDKYGQVKLIDL